MGKLWALALAMVMLVARPAAAEDENPWKPIFFGSLAVAIGANAFWALSYVSVQSEADQIEATKADGGPITHEDCNDRAMIMDDEGGHFDSACAWRSRSRTAMAFSIGFSVVALATAYLAFRDRDDVAITPTVSVDGAGASLQLRW